jgi:hypothetical protein
MDQYFENNPRRPLVAATAWTSAWLPLNPVVDFPHLLNGTIK